MSLIVTIVVNDGIVMASDSRTTQSFTKNGIKHSYPLTDNANKTFLTNNRFGVSMCGEAGANGYPLSSFIQQFIDSYNYEKDTKVESFANALCEFLLSLKLKSDLLLHVAGYEEIDSKFIAFAYRCFIDSKLKSIHVSLESKSQPQIMWDGQHETINRLVKQQLVFEDFTKLDNLTINNSDGSQKVLHDVFAVESTKSNYFPAAQIDIGMFTIQDAIDFARFAIRTTIDTLRFTSTEKTVGGPIDVLVIRPFEATWINKKELK